MHGEWQMVAVNTGQKESSYSFQLPDAGPVSVCGFHAMVEVGQGLVPLLWAVPFHLELNSSMKA